MKRRSVRQSESGSGRPYMPTPDEFVNSLDTTSDESFLDRKPAKRRRPSRRKRWILITLLLITAVGLIYVAYIASILLKVSTQPLDVSGLARDTSSRTNILVLGLGDPGHAGEKLTDTMLILSYDATTKRLAEISIPRDLRVSIPDHGTGKINSANALGGSDLAAQTVSNTFGIPINYVVQTNFTGLRELVDAVGGLDVNVKQRLLDTEYPCDNNQYQVCGLDIKAGLQHMTGSTALQYVRCRKGNCGNDFGRAARQQEVLGLLRTKLVRWQTVLNPKDLIGVTSAIRDSLTTNMGAVQLLQFGLDWQASQKNNPIQLVFSTSPGGYLKSGGGSDLLPADGTFAAMSERVQHIFTDPIGSGDLPK